MTLDNVSSNLPSDNREKLLLIIFQWVGSILQKGLCLKAGVTAMDKPSFHCRQK